MDRALNLLRGVLAARRGIDPRQLDDDVDLDDLGLDYLDRVALAMELEQLLGVRLADARLPELRYLSDLASWLEGAAVQIRHQSCSMSWRAISAFPRTNRPIRS